MKSGSTLSKEISILLSVFAVHIVVNLFFLAQNYHMPNHWLAVFYVLSFSLGLLLNYGSEKISSKYKIQIGQAFMILSTLKLVLLAVLFILVIKSTEINKLAGVLHFVLPYYLGTGIAVFKLLKRENLLVSRSKE